MQVQVRNLNAGIKSYYADRIRSPSQPIDDERDWKKADAIYHRSRKGGGSWEYKKPIRENWVVSYKDLRFKISPTGFKHTGLFPEQAANWDFIMKTIREAKANSDQPIRVLNLFAYTGGATMAASKPAQMK